MGNSTTKGGTTTSGPPRGGKKRTGFSFKMKNRKNVNQKNGSQTNRDEKSGSTAKPRLEKKALSLRPNTNNIDTVLPMYYDVDWSKSGQLGKGHYAVVFRGKNKATGVPVAVKRIQRKLARDQTLKTEVDALFKVSGHPNIVQVHDVFYDNRYVVVIMELLAGGELFERIVSSGAYSERDASQHIRKIASALKFMHGKGIVHRDLKPENLVLVDKTPDSEIKISDFGLSKILREDQATMQTVCGTRAYSAPEVNFGGPPRSGKYNEKVDTWSLGVILYVLLAAYHPFDPYGESNDQEIWSRICQGKWDFNDEVWQDISNQAKDLILNLICLDVSKRYDAAQILEHPWITRYQEMPNKPIRMASSLGSLVKIPVSPIAVDEDKSTQPAEAPKIVTDEGVAVEVKQKDIETV